MAFELTSSAFDDGTEIPQKYGYRAENVNPPLEFSGVPDAAVTLALVVDDPDAIEPAGKVWDHWVVWNVPATHGRIPEDWDAQDADEGENDYGELGYAGPNPPDGVHAYRFRGYALNSRLELEPGSTKSQLEMAMDGAILDRTVLEGTYVP